MGHAKDFDKVDDAYVFYCRHTDQQARTVEALRAHLPATPPRSVLDFGCGEGHVLTSLMQGWTPAAVLLVDPAESRLQAETTLRQWGVPRVLSVPALADLEPRERVDLILANQVLFYVEDLRATLADLAGRLHPGGRLLIAQAGTEKSTTQVRDAYYAWQGRTNPYYRAEDVENTLTELGLPFESARFTSTLSFVDTQENRLTLMRFLVGEPAATHLLDPYQTEDRIILNNIDRLLCVPAEQR